MGDALIHLFILLNKIIILIVKPIIMRLPNNTITKNNVFNLRLNNETQQKLYDIAKTSIFKNNKSEVIRYLIHIQHDKLND